MRYRECPTCANFGEDEICNECDVGENYEPKFQDLDFHDEDEDRE